MRKDGGTDVGFLPGADGAGTFELPGGADLKSRPGDVNFLFLELEEEFFCRRDHAGMLDSLQQLDEAILGEASIQDRDVHLGLFGFALAERPIPRVGIDHFAKALHEMALLLRMPSAEAGDFANDADYPANVSFLEFNGTQTEYEFPRCGIFTKSALR